MKRMFFNPLGMLLFGVLLGIISKLFDIYTKNLGNIFSQLTIWILLGVLISIYSKSKIKVMLNVLIFCLSMLLAYYSTASITNEVYNSVIIAGWIIFAFCSPIFAYFTWITKEKGKFAKVISILIILVSILSNIILFDGFRIYDYIINFFLIYLLFFKKIYR